MEIFILITAIIIYVFLISYGLYKKIIKENKNIKLIKTKKELYF